MPARTSSTIKQRMFVHCGLIHRGRDGRRIGFGDGLNGRPCSRANRLVFSTASDCGRHKSSIVKVLLTLYYDISEQLSKLKSNNIT